MSRYVSIYPGSPIVELPGETTTMTVVVRNVSEIKLTGLRLEVKSEACSGRVSPDTLPEIIPGDRKSFSVALARDSSKAKQRYPLQLTLHAGGLPVPAGLDLMVDLSPPPEKGWIDVGQVTLVAGSGTKRAYYLLGGAPLLFVLAWLLWRWSRRPRTSDAVASPGTEENTHRGS